MRTLVVINPSSSDFEAKKKWPMLEERLQQSGDLYVLETNESDVITTNRIIEVTTAGFDRVVSIGGDGTVHLVLNALVQAALKGPTGAHDRLLSDASVLQLPSLAVIPFGTANDVAKSLQLPTGNLEQLAAIAMGDRTTGLDIGHVVVRRLDGQMSRKPGGEGDASEEERIFVDAVTLGMDADVLAERSNFRDLKGYLSYIPAIADRALEQQSMDVRVVVDGEALDERVFNIVINNVPVYAGELTMPDSHPDDGKLDIYLFNRLEYASKFVTFAIQQADFLGLGVGELLDELTDNQRAYHGRHVKVRLASPRRVQVDGEIFGESDEIEARIVAQIAVAVP